MKIASPKPHNWWLTGGFLVANLLLVFPAARAEQTVPDQDKKLDSLRALRTEKVAAFKATFPGVKVEINPITGVPEELRGDLSKGLSKADPSEAAYQFFELNKEMYGLDQPKAELKVLAVENIRMTGQSMVNVKQLYNGVEIWHSRIRVVFDRSGKLRVINGTTLQSINISTTHSIDSLSAINLTKQDLVLPLDEKSGSMAILGEEGKPSASLMVFPFKGKYYLSWVVKVWGGPDNSLWQYFIDAKSGEIIHKYEDVWDYSEPKKSGRGNLK